MKYLSLWWVRGARLYCMHRRERCLKDIKRYPQSSHRLFGMAAEWQKTIDRADLYIKEWK